MTEDILWAMVGALEAIHLAAICQLTTIALNNLFPEDKSHSPCECSDGACPVHPGESCHHHASTNVKRIDMDDRTGTNMCEGCANDCLESGMFTLGYEEEPCID